VRVLLAGSPAGRERLRPLLNGSAHVVGEFDSLAAARAVALRGDAILIAPDASSTDEDEFDEPLTAREVQVLELLAEGLPNKAIAERLRISDQTVKFHVSSISAKLGARNRTDAVRRAVRRGLITL